MINIKTPREIELMRIAGNIVYMTHQYLKPYIEEGITTIELDKLAYDFIISNNASPSFKGFGGFPGSICTSINDVVVHGIPDKTKLKNGDIIAIDIGANYKGYHGDSAWSYVVGEVSSEKKLLMEYTKLSLYEGIKEVKPGNKISDISKAIDEYATKYNLGIVRELVGHGIGSELHEDPNVPNYYESGFSPKLKEGMVIAIEPMLNLGTADVYVSDDEWTVRTNDHKPSAHFEHTVLVTKDGYEILTGEWYNGKTRGN